MLAMLSYIYTYYHIVIWYTMKFLIFSPYYLSINICIDKFTMDIDFESLQNK